MAPRYLNPTAEDGVVKVLQLSDLHLFADAKKDLLGVNTFDSFCATVDTIASENREYDFIAVTGDISQDYSVASYERFASKIRDLNHPVFFLPGNHDDGPLMYRIFGRLGVEIAKNVITPKWQFIFLNSEIYAAPHGWIEKRQLDYASFCAARSPEQHIAVLVHHLPKLVGSTWLDAQTMANSADFNAHMQRMGRVKLVLTGHVHQEFDTTCRGVRYIATPSTSIQFTPKATEFSLDNLGPGWRYLSFKPDGTVDTVVHRMDSNLFVPDVNVQGY